MKNKVLVAVFMFVVFELTAQIETKKVTVNYFENKPFFSTQADGKFVGIEYEILEEFKIWAKAKKNIQLEYDYKAYQDFTQLYENVKSQTDSEVIGSSSVTITEDRKNEVNFSSPYLQNKSVLLSNNAIKTLKAFENSTTDFSKLKAVTLKGSVHEKNLLEIKKQFLPDLEIEYVKTPSEIVNKIAGNTNYFGYIDLITYWNAITKDKKSTLKIHNMHTTHNEQFGFIMNKNSNLDSLMNEFFESGFGFTATKIYQKILENYLGYEIISTVELSAVSK